MKALKLALLAAACRVAPGANQTSPQPDAAINAGTPVRLEFRAASDSFAGARDEYERLWRAEGQRIISTLESTAGLRFMYPQFADTMISVSVREAVSNSGYRDLSGMILRASYSAATKKATLMHELGHRLMAGLFRRDEEEHDELFLWLYDAWVALYGKEFADEQVVVEKRRRGPYPSAWDSALSLTARQRATEWRRVLAERLPTRL